MLTNIYECLAITLRSWRSLCDHCELMANGIRKPILHTFATGETSITFETPQKRPRMLTNRYECLAIICYHYEFMANCIRKPIRHIFATVWEQHNILISATSNFLSCALFNAHVSVPYIIAGLTAVLHTFPLTLKLIHRSHWSPDTLFQFFPHPDCMLWVISASKSPFSANAAPSICL